MSDAVAFRLRHDLSFGWLTCENEEDFSIAHDFAGRALGGVWPAPKVVQLQQEGIPYGDLGDFPTFGTTPVFSSRAIRILEPLLRGNGELLRLRYAAGDFFVFNVTAVVDVLDESRSVLRRFSDGRVMQIVQPRFDLRTAPDLPGIFKVPQSPRTDVFVRTDFAATVEANSLRGFDFEPVLD